MFLMVFALVAISSTAGLKLGVEVRVLEFFRIFGAIERSYLVKVVGVGAEFIEILAIRTRPLMEGFAGLPRNDVKLSLFPKHNKL